MDMDIGFVLSMIRPGAKYRSYQTYGDLVRTWDDGVQILPTMPELLAAWNGGLEQEFNDLAIEAELREGFDAYAEIQELKARIAALENP